MTRPARRATTVSACSSRARRARGACWCSRPGTSASAAYFRLVGRRHRGAPAGLAGVVGRAAREPARGPLDGRPLQARRRSAARASSTTTSGGSRTGLSRRTSSRSSPTVLARDWGMSVAVEDLRRVVRSGAARGPDRRARRALARRDSSVAYATWDFAGRAGGDDLDGLVLIDGGSSSRAVLTPARARRELANAEEFGSVPRSRRDRAGVERGRLQPRRLHARAARADRTCRARHVPAAPGRAQPPVPATNRGGYGYAFDAETARPASRSSTCISGSLAPAGDPRDWVGRRARAGRARGLGCSRVPSAWTAAPGTTRAACRSTRARSNGGSANAAQRVLGVRTTHGRDLDLPIYAFETSLGKGRVLARAPACSHAARASGA